MDLFRYQPLSSSEARFRVLSLLPGNDSDPIHCKLSEESVEGSVNQYEALSYLWGNPKQTEIITIDDCKLGVTANVLSALQHLRLKDQTRRLWIDAICINQDDMVERGRQVQVMEMIYRNAQMVVIWLGLGERKVNESSLGLSDDEATGSEGGEDAFTLASRAEASEGDSSDLMIHLFDTARSGWADLCQIFLHDYWKRTWIIQELALAAKAVVMRGEATCTWSALSKLQRLVRNNRIFIDLYRSEFFVFTDPMNVISNALPASIDSILSPRGHEKSTGLLELLQRFRSSQATNPRDKVYGMLGLAEEAFKEDLKVDYSKGVAEIYADVTRSFITHSRNVNFLADCFYRPEEFPDAPSWVPNWTAKLPPKYVSLHELSIRAPFNAPGSLEMVVSIDGNSLLVSGVIVAPIVDLAGVEDLARPNGLDGHVYSDAVSKKHGIDNNDYWIIQAVNRNMDGSLYSKKEPGMKREGRDPTMLDRAPNMMGEFRAPNGRRFFGTDIHVCGLAPVETEIGDLVCVIFGCQVPIVLRKVGERYKILGESYLHGFMDGEIESKMKDGRLHPETFRLC
ncbi:heterokaryon incompatibility protein-domain-containing protein [Tricladium varicosporioides]|nr:heterokaryon incompatibility protein-domain-containing protein [Hymenoscyphus varicosporioides]